MNVEIGDPLIACQSQNVVIWLLLIVLVLIAMALGWAWAKR